MAKLRLILILALLCGSAFATTRTSASCSQSDVATTVALAATNDTTIISATGSPCTWTTLVTSTVSQTIQCASGVSIVLSASDFITFDYHINDNGVEQVLNCALSGSANSSAILIQGKPNHFRISGNTFTNIGHHAGFIGTQADSFPPCYPIYGSFDNNTWNETNTASEMILVGGCNENWRSANTMGTSSAVFVWANTCNYNGNGYNNSVVCLDAGSGAQLVFAFNTINQAWVSFHDTGSNPSSRATRQFEVHDNITHCSKGATSNTCGAMMDLRGGTGRAFNNKVDIDVTGANGWGLGSSTEIYRIATVGGEPFNFTTGNQSHGVCNYTYESFRLGCSNDQSVCYSNGTACGGASGTCTDSCTTNANCGGGTATNSCVSPVAFDGPGTGGSLGYPSRDQTGVGPDAANNNAVQTAAGDPVVIWGNTNPLAGNALVTPFVTVAGLDSNFIQANRDYYEQPSSFTCATGVGNGLLASRPAAAGCTNGVYWWESDHNQLDQMVAGAWVNAVYVPLSNDPFIPSNGPTLNGAFTLTTGTFN